MTAAPMIPITFCASFPPCPRLNNAEETNCNFLNHCSALCGFDFLQTHIIKTVMKYAVIIPNKGARKINAIIGNTLAYSITSTPPGLKPPAKARAAPMKPPIKVWEDDEGIPNFHVARFHKIAAINPAKITSKVRSEERRVGKECRSRWWQK